MRLTCKLKFDWNSIESSNCTKGSHEIARRSDVAPELEAAHEKLLFPWEWLALNSSNETGFSTVAVATSVPHFPQNLASTRSAVPQFCQNIMISRLRTDQKNNKILNSKNDIH